MGKQAAGVCLRGPGAMLGSPGRGHLAPPMDPRQGVAGHHLASEIPKWGAKLALSEEENSNRMDFQAVARLYCVRAPRKKNADVSPYDWYPGGLPG